MAVLSLLYFGILLITHGTLGVPWSARPAARYEGYDLERGPVLYEAYYPEEQDIEIPQSPSIYQEKRYFDRGVVAERSYQIPTDPYEMPNNYDSDLTRIREEYPRPDSGYLSPFTAARPQTVQIKGYDGQNQRKKEYVFADQPGNEQLSQNHLRLANTDHFSLPESHPRFYGNDEVDRNREESPFVEENRMNYGEDVQRIVPINDEYIFGEPPMKNVPDFRESSRHSNEGEMFGSQNFGIDYNRGRPIQTLPMENIFEPRPQKLNYVFSTPKKSSVFKQAEIEQDIEDNDWPRNYGDNLIQGEIIKADEQELKNEEAKIASIEVSQVPHHKIRHHHGELPKRNYSRL